MTCKTISELKQDLINRIFNALNQGAEAIKEVTPIDTQRLYESVDTPPPIQHSNKVFFRITLGGKSLYGIRRETNIKRDVNYAKYVEARYHFVRSQLGTIVWLIKKSSKK